MEMRASLGCRCFFTMGMVAGRGLVKSEYLGNCLLISSISALRALFNESSLAARFSMAAGSRWSTGAAKVLARICSIALIWWLAFCSLLTRSARTGFSTATLAPLAPKALCTTRPRIASTRRKASADALILSSCSRWLPCICDNRSM